MDAVHFYNLPALGAPLGGGTFSGITTLPDDAHYAVVLLPGKGDDLTWQQACEWAEEQDGTLPTRHVAALLFANAKSQLTNEWHWAADEVGASYAWICSFYDGSQLFNRKSYEGSAVAVRLIPLSS